MQWVLAYKNMHYGCITALIALIQWIYTYKTNKKTVQYLIVSNGSDSSSEYIHKTCLQQTLQTQLLQVDVCDIFSSSLWNLLTIIGLHVCALVFIH